MPADTEFGRHQHLIAAATKKLAEQPLRFSVAVRPGRVIEDDARVIRRRERCQRGFAAHSPITAEQPKPSTGVRVLRLLSAIDCILVRLAGCAATCQNRFAI